MPKDIFYDLETTGTEPAFDLPLQFAAIEYDAVTGAELSRVNLRGRPFRHVLPSPMALAVTGQSISAVLSNPLSQYELNRRMFDFWNAQKGAKIFSFNGIKFDEEMQRHSFYQTLQNPYVTQFNDNKRSDVLCTLRATAAAAPDAVTLPINAKGKPSMKLEDVVKANGYIGHDAHDALGDVEATRYLRDLIHQTCPGIRAAHEHWCCKDRMIELFAAGEPVVEFAWNNRSGKPLYRTLVPLCADDENASEWLFVAADTNLEQLFQMSPEMLALKFGTKPLRRIKANAMATVAPATALIAKPHASAVGQEFVNALRHNEEFRSRVRQANLLRKAQYDEPATVWQRLYSGGFYPQSADKALFTAFHSSPPAGRFEIATSLSDPRARELAMWLLGSEWPDLIPNAIRSTYSEKRRERLMQDDADWMTVPKALQEIEQAKWQVSPQAGAILEEYEAALLRFMNKGELQDSIQGT